MEVSRLGMEKEEHQIEGYRKIEYLSQAAVDQAKRSVVFYSWLFKLGRATSVLQRVDC